MTSVNQIIKNQSFKKFGTLQLQLIFELFLDNDAKNIIINRVCLYMYLNNIM